MTAKAAPNGAFESQLEKGKQRFLAHVIVHGLEIGRRRAADFLRHFPPSDLMGALERRPQLRADILEAAIGIHRKVALKKSALSSGDDLQIALDEGVTTPEEILGALPPDDRVRHLDEKKLWAYAIEGEFWQNSSSKKKAEVDRAKEHISFVLDRALQDGLITHRDLITGIGVDTLAESLPRPRLSEVLRTALEIGSQKKSFTERDLCGVTTSRILCEDISLAHVWSTVVAPKIAEAHGLVEAAHSATAAAEAATETEPAKAAAAKSPTAKADRKAAKTEPPPTKGKKTTPASSAPLPGMPRPPTDPPIAAAGSDGDEDDDLGILEIQVEEEFASEPTSVINRT